MAHEMIVLTLTAAFIGFFHTLLGPDHYLPFIMMSKAGQWSKTRTTWITFLCGIGHVASSVALGAVGIAFGIALGRLEAIEGFRGNLAAWGLILFGLAYFLWGVQKARKDQGHEDHHHHHPPLTHGDRHENLEPQRAEERKNLTPWILFTIFVFGPCEPLIPILMYPAADNNIFGVVVVTLVFAVATIATMMSIVHFSSERVNSLPFRHLERYTHAVAGATIFLAGMAIQFLGL